MSIFAVLQFDSFDVIAPKMHNNALNTTRSLFPKIKGVNIQGGSFSITGFAWPQRKSFPGMVELID